MEVTILTSTAFYLGRLFCNNHSAIMAVNLQVTLRLMKSAPALKYMQVTGLNFGWHDT